MKRSEARERVERAWNDLAKEMDSLVMDAERYRELKITPEYEARIDAEIAKRRTT